ncbi:hypothetical protein KEJ29_06030 [Candidatus Bathyarchaeota archaeon]|nr:hypothetical protein [Candidatus Bathyarchaeota archaeon]
MLGLMHFLSVKKIVFGLNAVQEIGLEAKALGCNAGHSAWSWSSLRILSAI